MLDPRSVTETRPLGYDSRLSQRAGRAAIVIIFAIAAVHRFSLPQLPIASADIGYFGAALNKLAGAKFESLHGVNFPYPVGGYLVLWVFEDFRGIGVIQHLLGLAAGAVFLGIWRCLRNFITSTPLRTGWHRWLGIGGLATYLLSNTPLLLESRLLADALCPFFCMLSLWLSIEAICQAIIRRNSRHARLLAIACIVSCLTLASLKPSFATAAAMIMVVTAFVVVRGAKGGAILAAIVATMIIGTGTCAALQSYFSQENNLTRAFLPQTLFTIHAKIIYEQMRDEVSKDTSSTSSAIWLRQACSDLGTTIEETHARYPKAFARLGFEPDYLATSWDDKPALLTRWRAALGEERYVRFLSYWYWHTLQQRPLAFVWKVAQQLTVFYCFDCPAFRPSRTLRFPYEHSVSVLESPSLRPKVENVPAARRLLEQTRELVRSGLPQARDWRAIHSLTNLAGRAYLPSLLLSFFACLWCRARRGSDDETQRGALLVIFLYAATFANVLSISVVHSMEVQRYSTVLFLPALLAELWAVFWISGLFFKQTVQSVGK